MDHLFFALQASAVAGGAYIGYRAGPFIKRAINTPTIKPYKDKIGFSPTNIINEDSFCNISGSLTGMMVCRMFWPIAIPVSLFAIERDYGSSIRKFIKDAKK